MNLEDFASLTQARSVESLKAVTERFAHELEFERYALQLAVGDQTGSFRWVNIENVPDGFRALWADKSRGAACPVMQHMRHSSVPIIWDRTTFEAAGLSHWWEEQVEWGYGTGLAVAAHLPDNLHVCVGLERAQELRMTRERLTEKAGQFQLFATCVIDVSVSLLANMVEANEASLLTKREQECLQWAFAGKTAWETGMILSISERTVAAHISAAKDKLGAVTKHQAALKALRLGWIN